MSEQRGYQCDGGCGATLVIDRGGSTMERGWWRIYPGRGEGPPLDACSAACAARAIQMNNPSTEGALPRG